MSLKSFILQSLFVLLFCTSFLSAMDSDSPGPNPFGQVDKQGKLKSYAGYLHYDNLITKEILVSEAKRVWKHLDRKRGPGMVSALSTGDGRIYFATSIKGPPGLNYHHDRFPPILTTALLACKEQHDDHVHNGRCAELRVIQEWFSENVSSTQLPPSHKLIVAVDYNENVRPPCSGEDKYGCADVLPRLGFADDEIVKPDPECHSPATRRGLTKRGCVPKKPTAKPSPRGKPKPVSPKAPSNRGPKPASPKTPAKLKAPSNRGPKPASPKTPAKLKAPSNRGPKPAPPRLSARPKVLMNKRPKH